MRLIDMHVHTGWDQEGRAGSYLEVLDKAGYEGAVVLSPGIESGDIPATPEKQRESADFVVRFASEAPDRLYPFVTIAPRVEGAADAVRYAADRGCVGVKMLPNHWYPYDEELLFPVYKAAEETGLPILFHSGILWAHMDSSRFCRPVYYEALIHFPKVRFALAHISWPWTDECLAVWGRINAFRRRNGIGPHMYIDTTPGTPRFYRKEALSRAFQYCKADWLIFGTDARTSTDVETLTSHADFDRQLLAELEISQADQEKYFRTNLLRFLGKE